MRRGFPAVVLAAVCFPVFAQPLLHLPLDGSLDNLGSLGGKAQIFTDAGEPAPAFVPGRIGEALDFSSRSAVVLPLELDHARYPQVTITAWVREEAGARDTRAVLATGSSQGARLGINGGRLVMRAGRTGVTFDEPFPVGEWVFVAGVVDTATGWARLHQNEATYRRDGIDTSTQAPRTYRSPNDPDADPMAYLIVGAATLHNWQQAARSLVIDDVRIYAEAFSEERIEAIRQAGTPIVSEVVPGIGQPIPRGAAAASRTPSLGIDIDEGDLPDRPRDILAELRTPLSRAQLALNENGAIAYLSVGVNLTMPWGNSNFSPVLGGWAGDSKRITEIAAVQGRSDVIAVAEFSEYGIYPRGMLRRGIGAQVAQAIGRDERIDLIALPANATQEPGYLLVTDREVYARGVPAGAVQIIENALAAGEEISAVALPGPDSYAIATSTAIHTANLPAHSTLDSHLRQLHASGERIEDIVIHPDGFGWSGVTGSYAIATSERVVGMQVNCDSFDQVRDWALRTGVPRIISCDGERAEPEYDEPPPLDIPDIDLDDNECEWGIDGTLSVHHDLDLLREELGQSVLRNVQVRVSGSTPVFGGWGPYNAWPSTRTDEYGRFSVRRARGCGERRMKLEVKFQDADLEVRHRTSTSSFTNVKWYEIGTFEGEAGHLVIDDFELGRAPGTSGLLVGDARDAALHADIWALYKSVIDLMRSRGPEFAFRKPVRIKYPHDGIAPDGSEASYANPQNGVIYITNAASFDNFTVDTLLHELGHIWSYQHSADSANLNVPVLNQRFVHCLSTGLLANFEFDTHGLVPDRCVAFHEGFAEYFKDQVVFELFRRNEQTCASAECPGGRPVPLRRAYLGSGPWTSNPPDPVTDLGLLERHDIGWYSALLIISDRNRGRHILDTLAAGDVNRRWHVESDYSASCQAAIGPDLDFWDILRSFSPGSGYPYFRPIGLADELQLPILADMNDTRFDNFLDRVAAINGLADADANALRRLVDPADTVEAWDVFCP